MLGNLFQATLLDFKFAKTVFIFSQQIAPILKVINFKPSPDCVVISFNGNIDWTVHVALYWDIQVEVSGLTPVV